jgi:hypothetical protein
VIAALFVQVDGCYAGLDDVDSWPEARDARLYPGPHPVVAHPPCERWGRYYQGGPRSPRVYKLGDDGGCFLAALRAVRAWGGVLEHPRDSKAFRAHGLNAPPRDGGWISAGLGGGWVCCVEQGWFGHQAQKPTWLFASGVELPSLPWGPSTVPARRGTSKRRGILERLSHRQRAATPPAFRDVLLGMARSAS